MDGYGNYTEKYPETIESLCGANRPGFFQIRCARPRDHDRLHLGKRFNHIYRW